MDDKAAASHTPRDVCNSLRRQIKRILSHKSPGGRVTGTDESPSMCFSQKFESDRPVAFMDFYQLFEQICDEAGYAGRCEIDSRKMNFLC